VVDFSLSDEHKGLIETARRFTKERIIPVAAECDRESFWWIDCVTAARGEDRHLGDAIESAPLIRRVRCGIGLWPAGVNLHGIRRQRRLNLARRGRGNGRCSTRGRRHRHGNDGGRRRWSHHDGHGRRTACGRTNNRPHDRRTDGNRWRRRLMRRYRDSRYGQRWQVETVMSMIKRRQGGYVLGRSNATLFREMSLKVLTHNIMIIAAAA
jgi:hypothetical protein